MELKLVSQIKNLKNKRILVRVDFNVPLKDGKIVDDFRIQKSLETIKYLVKNNAKIILISHLGRPDGKMKKEFSLKPVALHLGKILKKNINFTENYENIVKLKEGEIAMLENIRFYPEEQSDKKPIRKKFAIELAKLGDIYVNEAFSNSHRDHASMTGLPKFLPAYAGFLLNDEVQNLSKILEKPKKPLIAVLGGKKILTKIKVIKNFLKKADYILIGGALANNFFAAKGYEIGKSVVEVKEIKLAKKILKNKKIVLPVDVIVDNLRTKNREAIIKSLEKVEKNDKIVDIGPVTVQDYISVLQKAKVIFYNGDMGWTTYPEYRNGTKMVLSCIANKDQSFTVVGGGETTEFVRAEKLEKKFDYVSTAGGAMLEFLSGKKLVALKFLKE